ncbi:hypothetical protein [Nonomuraea sp. NPDC050691]|uniref:hypothetical protein n=1 Tax=Nonomuraea sp. NPDC050691 TaxID=3155661 RepID=UPI0033F36E81
MSSRRAPPGVSGPRMPAPSSAMPASSALALAPASSARYPTSLSQTWRHGVQRRTTPAPDGRWIPGAPAYGLGMSSLRLSGGRTVWGMGGAINGGPAD